MSIFGSIWSKISGHHEATSTASQQAAASPASVTNQEPTAAPPVAAPAPNAAQNSGPAPTPVTSPASASGAASAPAPSQTTQVDVAAVLTGLASKHREKLDWKHSIVDLLKTLDLDSSHSARIALAQELHYSGDTGDSATMNMWLQKQVMAKLAENGGKVPDDLKD